MRIGVPKEIKNHEHRVAMTPQGVKQLTEKGHDVLVQEGAGTMAGFTDEQYQCSGAQLVANAYSAWTAELVVKVKEPLAEEYGYLGKDLTLFTYLHLAAAPELMNALLASGTCAIGYETVQLNNGSLPLLTPMSCVAGRLAAQMGAFYLQIENGSEYPGKGLLMGNVQGAPNAHVLILGGGNVGRNAADVALGMGAKVTIMDVNQACLSAIDTQFSIYSDRLTTVHYQTEQLDCILGQVDLLIGAALVPGEKAPQLLSRERIGLISDGSVFVDVAIDQGGMAKTSRATSYDEPVYVEEGVIHCCLPNLPGCVPRSSTLALTSTTLPYVQALAECGIAEAAANDAALQRGINVQNGQIIHPALMK